MAWHLWWIFPTLFLLFLVVRLFLWTRGCGWGGRGFGRRFFQDALKARLASGEITEEQYRRISDILEAK